MAELPDVVRRKIFHHLGRAKNQRDDDDWRRGRFMPAGAFFHCLKTDDRDRLKFCLIYPEYVAKLNIDLNQVSSSL